MKFISESPTEKYVVIRYNGINIFLNRNDNNRETRKNAKAFCRKHGYCHGIDKTNAVYYLRGHRYQADYKQVLKGISYGSNLPVELNEVIHCLSFWNQEGGKNHAMNKTRDESFTDFVLKCIAADCEALIEPYPDLFITGKGGNHVWVDDSSTNQRILLIHF